MSFFTHGISDLIDGVGDLALQAGQAAIAKEFPERTETNPVPQTSAPDNAVAEVQQAVVESRPNNQQLLMYGGLAVAGMLTLYLVLK